MLTLGALVGTQPYVRLELNIPAASQFPSFCFFCSSKTVSSGFPLCQLAGGGGGESQRLVGYARLLGELYNYAVVGSPTIFETLHLLVDSGHEV